LLQLCFDAFLIISLRVSTSLVSGRPKIFLCSMLDQNFMQFDKIYQAIR